MPNIDDLQLNQVVDYGFKVGSDGKQLVLYYFPDKKNGEFWSRAEPGAKTLREDQLPAEIFDQAQRYLAKKFFRSDN